jgi:hypothetical protein
MSTSSKVYAEVRRNNQWEAIPAPKQIKGKLIPVDCIHLDTSCYELYAALTGYHRRHLYHIFHTEEIVPLSQPRGLPEDMSAVYAQYFDSGSMAGRWCITWFMVQEVIDYDWDRRFTAFTGYVKSEYASLFCESDFFPIDFPENEIVYTTKREGTTEVSWVESYRTFVSCVDWFIEELKPQGSQNHFLVGINHQLRGEQTIASPTFPGLQLTAEQVLRSGR